MVRVQADCWCPAMSVSVRGSLTFYQSFLDNDRGSWNKTYKKWNVLEIFQNWNFEAWYVYYQLIKVLFEPKINFSHQKKFLEFKIELISAVDYGLEVRTNPMFLEFKIVSCWKWLENTDRNPRNTDQAEDEQRSFWGKPDLGRPQSPFRMTFQKLLAPWVYRKCNS